MQTRDPFYHSLASSHGNSSSQGSAHFQSNPFLLWDHQELLNYAYFLEQKIQECLGHQHQPPQPKTPPVSDPDWKLVNNGDNDGDDDDKTKNPSPAIYSCKRVVIYRGFFIGWPRGLDRWIDESGKLKGIHLTLDGHFDPPLSTPLSHEPSPGDPGTPPYGHRVVLPTRSLTGASPQQDIVITSGGIKPLKASVPIGASHYILDQNLDDFSSNFTSSLTNPDNIIMASNVVQTTYNSKVLALYCRIYDWEKIPGCPPSSPTIEMHLWGISVTLAPANTFVMNRHI